jgi:two-component system, sensor histidine kinase PdtaS
VKKIASIALVISIYILHLKVFANEDTLSQKIAATAIDTAKVDLLNQAAEQLKITNEEQALDYAKNALTLALNKNYHTGTANAYYQIAEIYKAHGKNSLALEYFNKAIRYYKVTGDIYALVKVYNKIGVIHFNKSDFDKAVFYYTKAFKLAEKTDDFQAHAGILNNIGNIYYTQGKYTEAINYYTQSLKIREANKDTNGIAGSLHNLASIYQAQGMYVDAEKFYQKAIALREVIGNKKGVALSYAHLGTLYLELKDIDKSLAYQNKALEIYKQLQDKSGLASTYVYIGNIYSDKGEYKKALDYFDNALVLFKEIDDVKGQATLYINLGNLYAIQKKYNEAITCLEKGRKISEEYILIENKRKAYLLLAEVYEKLNENSKAVSYYKLYYAQKDSLNNIELTTQMAEIQKRYEDNAKQNQIEVLQKEKENQELKIRQNANRITILIISLIALTAITLLVIISNRHKQKTNTILAAQNEDILRQKNEKEVLLKEIHHRVKNNLQVINSLLRLQSAMIDDPKVVTLFDDCQTRVRSMALIHDKLYSIKDLSSIQVKDYIENLTGSLIETYGLKTKVDLKLDIKPVSFTVDALIPLGLLLNEIISNSLKYAFKNLDSGIIEVSLKPLNNQQLELIISDNGEGFSKDIFNSPQNSLGVELIKAFVDQLDGTIEKLDISGTAYRIVFQNIGDVKKTN